MFCNFFHISDFANLVKIVLLNREKYLIICHQLFDLFQNIEIIKYGFSFLDVFFHNIC